MEEYHTVIIVGAGIAGLAAASKLKTYGYDFVLLEGRDRVGGRIVTDDSLGVPLDIGASWIHGKVGNPIAHLANIYNIELRKTDDSKSVVVYDTDGKRLGSHKLNELSLLWRHFIQYTKEDQKTANAKTTLESSVDEFKQKYKITDDEGFEYELSWQIEIDWGDDTKKLSEKYFDKASYLLPGAQDVFPKGYIQIVDGLVRDIGEEKIKKNQKVNKIEHNADGVTVITDKQTLKGKYVICTLPLGVLKNNLANNHIEFSDPLPEEKIEAIKRMGMGIFHKTYFKFQEPFWINDGDKDKDWINYIPEKEDQWITFLNLYKITGEPVLLGLNYGKYASQLEKLAGENREQEIKDAGMKVLKTIFPEAPDPVDILVSNWKEDPFTRGAYSTSPVGEHLDDYDKLAAPIPAGNPRIFFAGEATTRMYPATVHGAYVTGIREANRLRAYDKKEFLSEEEQLVKEWDVFPEYVICKDGFELVAKKYTENGITKYCPKCVSKEEKPRYLEEGWMDGPDPYVPE